MNKTKRIFVSLAVLLISTSALVGCGGEKDPNPIPPPTPVEPTAETPTIYEGISEDSKRIPLVGPFTIYTEDGQPATDLKTLEPYTQAVIDCETNVFDNMYEAIRIAGLSSSTKNKLQVQDANHVQIYARKPASNWFVFNEHDYVGVAPRKEATKYIDANPKSYAVLGTATDYARLGKYLYDPNCTVDDNVLELFAGAYNYMFSKNGVGAGENGQNINGFSYAKATLRLSEMKYKLPTDGHYWNAYIFFNLQQGIHSDLGMIGTKVGNQISWRICRNCNSKSHGTAGFSVYQDKVVTVSTKYDPATREYSGFDDLEIEVLGVSNGWYTNITNLRTGQVVSAVDLHYQADGVTPLVENTPETVQYGRVLVASSYCPVTGNVWNWDCGASTKNVIWENIKIGRYVSDNIDDYRALSYELVDFTHDSEYLRDGYSQGGFCASFEAGYRQQDGTYASGATYKKGDYYLIQNVDYNS